MFAVFSPFKRRYGSGNKDSSAFVHVSIFITLLLLLGNKNALKNGQSSLLGDLIRIERVINSTRNRISTLNVFHVLLYRRLSNLQDISFLYCIRRFDSELLKCMGFFMKMVCNIFFSVFFLGWRPRRSIVLCSWGGEEYGLLGSTEWVEVCKTLSRS